MLGVEGRDIGEAIVFRDIPVTGSGLQSVTIPVKKSARYVELTVFNWRGGWTFLSEVSFTGGSAVAVGKGGR
jgi:hypothetical protein